MKGNLKIIKIGGNIIDDDRSLDQFLQIFSEIKGYKILVHGGGKLASSLLKQLGLEVQLVHGRRITDADTLDIVSMVYAGKINKTIVARLQGLNTNALGMSGADANSIVSSKRAVKDIDYGYVGDVVSINSEMLTNLIELGLVPVFCALTHDVNGQLLNTNADTIASELAIGLSEQFEVELFYCFEKKGVLSNTEDENSIIKEIDFVSYQRKKEEAYITDGMIPKLDNCFYAISKGVAKVCIGNSNMLVDKDSLFTTLKP